MTKNRIEGKIKIVLERTLKMNKEEKTISTLAVNNYVWKIF